MAKLNVIRVSSSNAWFVTGDSVEATVFGSVKYGPNGVINGKGAMKFRKEILEAVEEWRKDNGWSR